MTGIHIVDGRDQNYFVPLSKNTDINQLMACSNCNRQQKK